jgi:hypothetical protein
MSRLIDADALKTALYYDVSKGTYGEFTDGSEVSLTDREILKLIDQQPTTDAEPVRHGKWEPCCEWHGTNGEVETRAYACSECAVIIPTDSYDVRFLRGCFLRYCPHCGARMDKDE